MGSAVEGVSSETILVVNAGSSSIKFQLFAIAGRDDLERRLKGQIEGVGVKPHLIARGIKGETLIDETWPASEVDTVPKALDRVVAFLRAEIGQLPTAIGHRVVHGGPDCGEPTLVGNSEEDERRFAAVARVSEINLGLYRTFVQPWGRLWANEGYAEWMRRMHSLRRLR